jgi:hypothetical protein
LAANTQRNVLSLHHAASAVRTVRVRRISIGFVNATATAAAVFFQVFRGTAAPTGGAAASVVTPNAAIAAAEVSATTNPTITTATLLTHIHYGTIAASGVAASQLVYDWQEGGETVPIVLRAGVLESLVIAVTASAAITITPYIQIILTEE